MGIFSALNPLTFGRKNQAAWNALMGSYTFFRLTAPEQHMVLGAANNLAESKLRRNLNDIVREKNGQIIFLNFLVYGMRECDIRPLIGGDLWFHLDNPFVACIGVEEVMDFQRRQMEKQYGVKFELEVFS